MKLFDRSRRRDRGDLVKFVYIRDNELIFRQFVTGAQGDLKQALEQAYLELKECRKEAQSGYNQLLVSYAILASAYFGILESFETNGIKISASAILSFSLLISALLGFRATYLQTRVSLLRGIFSAYLARLNNTDATAWIVSHPISQSALALYSPFFGWPRMTIPANRRIHFEIVEAIILATGAITIVLALGWLALAAYWKILLGSEFSWPSILTVGTAACLYVASWVLPKFGTRKRLYRHVGLLHLMQSAKSTPEKYKRRLSQIALAQDRLGGPAEG